MKVAIMQVFKSVILSLFSVIFMTVACTRRTSGGTVEIPNIVLIISDDQSWTDYSFMGHPSIETPNIDRLAREGLTFTRGYTTAPLCRPALASIITGLYPRQHGILGNDPLFNFEGENKWGVEWLKERQVYNEPLIALVEKNRNLVQCLNEAGYLSLQTGKWWEGHYTRGGFTDGMTHGDPDRNGRHGDDGLTIGRDGLERIYHFVEDAAALERPFFIWYAPFMPHAPHTPPESLEQKYLAIAPTPAVARYWAMCEWFDSTCGALMNFVDQKGLSENTLFIYVTDNGWIQDPDHPNRYAARSKREPYDMGIRTPVIFRWQGTIAPDMDSVSLVSSTDIATTILGICHIEPPEKMQGLNVLNKPELKGRRAIFAENHTHDFSTPDSSILQHIIIAGEWKLIVHDETNKSGKGPELYQLLNDPFEWKNLAEDFPEKVQELNQQIDRWKQLTDY